MDLSGNVIPESGLFVVVPTSFTLRPLSEIIAEGGMVVDGLIFENNDNVTHVLVRGYQGREVTVPSDQWGELAVDIDPNNDGSVIDPLPWAETLDAIGVLFKPNDQVDVSNGLDEFGYGEALGFEDIGPDGSFAPGHVFRGANDGRWNIGVYALGVTDTPGLPNLDSPTEPIIESFSPRTILPGGSFSIFGRNFSTATEVRVGEAAVAFTIVDDAQISIVMPAGSVGGVITVTNPSDSVTTTGALRILQPEQSFVFYEDFEADLGDFLVVSMASNFDWRHRSFGGNNFAEMTGFRADVASDDWLISPEIDLAGITNAVLEFVTAINFSGPDLEVLLSANYAGGNPNAATWTPLEATLSEGGFTITSSGPVSLADWAGETIHIAFRYTSDGPESGQGTTAQVHEFMVTKREVFESGWVVHPQLGDTYLVSAEWAYHAMMNFVHVGLYPWIFHPDYGWLLHVGGHPSTGAWFYSQPLGFLWSRADLGGDFYYEDGTTDNFFLGPQ